jgi:hydroxymethylpyrimidine pyrophosphatase-like HAD family hydrolase
LKRIRKVVRVDAKLCIDVRRECIVRRKLVRNFDSDGSLRREWVRFLVGRLGEDRFSMRVGGTTSVDITAKGIDKASGVRRLLDTLGWKADNGLYFGDRFEETGNDHPVLQVMDCVNVHGPEQTLEHFRALLQR